jgi:hypothetical protein
MQRAAWLMPHGASVFLDGRIGARAVVSGSGHGHSARRATSRSPALPTHASRPVLILSDHVAMKVRLGEALERFSPVLFASTEPELLSRLSQQPVRVVVIHGAPPFADPRLPARVRHANLGMAAPIVVLASSKDPAWAGGDELIASGQVDDIIHIDSERVESLIAAWSLHSDRCRRKVEALRLAHQSAPDSLHRFLEELLLNDSADLSVTAWAAGLPAGSRFTLRRTLQKEGVKPSVLVDAARVLNVVARVLVRGRGRLKGRLAALPDVRSARRLLMRTLGVTPREISQIAEDEDGAAEVRDRTVKAVGEMLRSDETVAGK